MSLPLRRSIGLESQLRAMFSFLLFHSLFRPHLFTIPTDELIAVSFKFFVSIRLFPGKAKRD